MYGFSTAVVLQVALFATNGSEYQKAYGEAKVAGKPLLVLVGTKDCHACRAMQDETLPELIRSGGLENVVYTQVDSKTNLKLTGQLLRGDSLPQLVLYTQVGELWRRTHLSGAQSADEISDFLERQIARGKVVAAQSAREKTTGGYNASEVIYSYSSGGT